MANLVWTSILYFSTLSIVFIIYRAFVTDRLADNELRTLDMVRTAHALGRKATGVSADGATTPLGAVRRPVAAAPNRVLPQPAQTR